jgi:ferritin-like metal-binding protein YciE
MGSMSSMAAAMAEDEVLKATFSNVAFENYEIAAYRSLIALAEQAGHAGDANELRRILREEEAMARWLAENVENVTRDYLARQGHSERVA